MIQETILNLAKADIGIKEIFQNRGWEGEDGSRVEKEMREVGWVPPQAYCSYWCMKIWYNAYKELGHNDMAEYVLKTLNSNAQLSYKKAQGSKFKVSGTPMPGSIGIMAFGDSTKGHAVLVVRSLKNGLIETYEGNTNSGGSRDGDGFYMKRRVVSFTKKKDGLYFLGFINPVEV